MPSRVNNSEACICCSRRADGLAVGQPSKLGWYCKDCGPDLAKIALALHARQFDAVEKRAACAIAEAAGGPIDVPAQEAPAFILWVVEQFADRMRKDMASGAPPF
jgi:hypothetical protein